MRPTANCPATLLWLGAADRFGYLMAQPHRLDLVIGSSRQIERRTSLQPAIRLAMRIDIGETGWVT